MKTKMVLGSCALAVFSFAGVAGATWFSNGGTACEPSFGFSNLLFRDYSGTSNDDANIFALLTCPVPMSGVANGQLNLTGAQVEVQDNSTTLRMACTPYSQFMGGAVVLGKTKETCSAAGGCTFGTGDVPKTGWMFLSWSAAELNPLTFINVVQNNGFRCDLPPKSGSGRSTVGAVQFITQ